MRWNPSRVKIREITKLPRRMLWAMVMEGVETTRMVKVFARHGTRKLRLVPSQKHPTQEQLREAIEQLKDLPRFLPFFVVIVVPVPGVTEGYAIMAVTVEKWLGHKFRLLPSRFKEALEETRKEKDAPKTS